MWEGSYEWKQKAQESLTLVLPERTEEISVLIFVERIAGFETLKLDPKFDVPNRKKKSFFLFWWWLFKLIMQIQRSQDIIKILVKLNILEMGKFEKNTKRKIFFLFPGLAEILMS